MKDITVGIKTFLRPNTLDCSLEALLKFDFAEVIVADDNPDSVQEEYEKVYSKYRTLLPLTILHLPYDTGVSASRNTIVTNAKTNFLLMLDDDQVINSSISLMYDVLESNTQLGGVSCYFNEKKQSRCTACDIYFENGYIVKELRRTPEVYSTKNSTRYSLFDFIPSATLFRLDCLQDVQWDSFYKTGAEHLDLFIRHKALKRWDFAVALDAYIDHIRHDDIQHDTKTYREHREGSKKEESWKYFNAKFGVEGKFEGVKLADGHPADKA